MKGKIDEPMLITRPTSKADINAEDIDKVIHEPGRLMILLHLYVVMSADFIYLMKQTGLSKGNLSSHLTKLEEAGYVMIIKEFIEKKPHTLIQLTDEGRKAFDMYREKILDLLK
ncbi:MAG TPA: transcriptional regulator [Candidatus Cloacimonadota bacterium]|nr:transcriptional regulator [Candidatus Cloacimonadota bacterium]